jgi:hypothetical protein
MGIFPDLASIFKHKSRHPATVAGGGGTLIFGHATVNNGDSAAQESSNAAPGCAPPGLRRSCGLRPVRGEAARDWG